jgi:hypothetical protein
LGAGFAWQRDELLKVAGTIHVHCDSGQVQHNARQIHGARGGIVRFETVVAEAQWKQGCGTA